MENTIEDQMLLATETNSIRKVEHYVDDLCAKLNVNTDHYGNILIALTEAVNNAMNHGNKMDPMKKVKLTCESSDTCIDFKIEDEGDGFDYDSLPDPTEPENIDKPNGRGVFLMKHLADEVSFHNDGRIIELRFNYN